MLCLSYMVHYILRENYRQDGDLAMSRINALPAYIPIIMTLTA